MATHLFNAMSGLHHRDRASSAQRSPGGHPYGIIADGHHVADAALRMALAAHWEGAIPVSDAMAIAGTDATGFTLGGRTVSPPRRQAHARRRHAGRCRHQSLVDALRHIARVTAQPLQGSCPWASTGPTAC
jgi:N-acetylglucosamine-6-phosphate deacetylase